MKNKKWYTSKTMWVNLIATGAIVAQSITGKEVLSPEIQTAILAGINILLRTITKSNITW